MIHSEGLTVEVCGEQGLGMAGRRPMASGAIHNCD